MNLTIDVGNTFIKAAIFEGRDLLHSYYHLQKEDLAKIAQESTFQYVLISSVKKDNFELLSLFNACEKCMLLTADMSIPLKNLYKTPQTLGMDRVCGAVGSIDIF